VHAHTDERWLVDGACASKVAQGVTTEIGGNCGTSIAPLEGLALERKASDARHFGLDVTWRSLDEFFGLVERSGVALNVATLVGLGTTRRCVRGDLEGRLTDDERAAQNALVREAIDHGALGVSSGLIYQPSRYADLEELIGLSAVARDAGAPLYVSHIRNEADELIAAVDEALAVGLGADVTVQFSHHKAWGKRNWGKVHRTLATIDAARRRGAVVYADVYPYVAGWTDLSTVLREPRLFGGREATLARLRDPDTATAIALELKLDHGDEWGDIQISTLSTQKNAELAGHRLADIARAWRMQPERAAIRLLLEEQLDVEAIFFAMTEDDVASVLSAGFTCIGSDANAIGITGPTARGVPHPRTFGCFPRVIGRFVRGRKTLELAEAIRRMTSLPAEIFRLRERGTIVEGAFADLVLFDPETIVDTATYEAPFSFPIGVAAVYVNGEEVVRDGSLTSARPGRVLRVR
jgi:N-acyl-D-amino-acid deacylase